MKKWGIVQWTRPLLNILFDGATELVAGELEQLLELETPDRRRLYYRFQTLLKEELEAIDNTKIQNVKQLQALGNGLIKEKNREIEELCEVLSNAK